MEKAMAGLRVVGNQNDILAIWFLNNRRKSHEKVITGRETIPNHPKENPINKTTALLCLKKAVIPIVSPLSESNQRPTDYKSVALPAELRRL